MVIGNLLGGLAVGAAAGAGSPLFVYEQGQWQFADWMLTALFAVYAITLLTTLLVAGSLSDHLGRRPVLVGALVLMLAASALYLRADDAGSLLLARALHGVATGSALSTFTAMIAESVPAPRRSAYTQIAATVPVTGLALGALVGGVAVSACASPVRAVFVPLVIVYVLAILAILATPETVSRSPGALRSLAPRAEVPPALRHEFRALIPLVMGTWMTTGLFLGLIPAVNRAVFGIDAGLTSALVVFLQPAAAAVAGFSLSRVPARVAALIGATGVTLGALSSWVGIASHHLPLLIAGAVLGGVGTGVGFAAVLRLLSPRAAVHERGGLLAAVYVVAYLSFGVPALIAGAAVGTWGFGATVASYCLVLTALGAAALAALLISARAAGRTASIHVNATTEGEQS